MGPDNFLDSYKHMDMGGTMIGELSGDTADFLNEIPWFDGIIYIVLLMGLYVFYKWVNKKFS